MVDVNAKDKIGKESLLWAIWANDYEEVKWLIENGAGIIILRLIR